MSLRKRNDGSGERYGKVSEMESGEKTQETLQANIDGDRQNIAVLLFLYILQGIPLGLLQAIPLILLKSGVNYRQQAQFSFVNWPFSMKLLWAPIVDCYYWSKIGKRKSWLVPTQYLLGIFMLYISGNVDYWLGKKGDSKEPSMQILTISFFILNFLAATQDIAVDGWALTMLKRKNVGYASTCNSVGQTAGYFLGYVLFIALESTDFCNTYLRSEPQDEGIVTLPVFLKFWGWVFLITTSLVWAFKSEKDGSRGSDVQNENLNIKQSYWLLWDIVKLKPVIIIISILLTCKIGFSAVDSVTGLKLIESGVPKEKLALLAIPLTPLQILLPLLISKYTAGPKPMSIFITAVPYRLLSGLIIAGIVYITPWFIDGDGVPIKYYVLLLVIYCVHQVAVYSMFVSQMAFFAKVSDPAVGGTYMTLLNTLANLGGNWPQTLALWFVDGLTYKHCSNDSFNNCDTAQQTELCTKSNGECMTDIDGYYIEVLLCTVVGFFWLFWGRVKIKQLEGFDLRNFRVVNGSRR